MSIWRGIVERLRKLRKAARSEAHAPSSSDDWQASRPLDRIFWEEYNKLQHELGVEFDRMTPKEQRQIYLEAHRRAQLRRNG